MSDRVRERPSIHVLAGTNGAGKSSVVGAAFRAAGGHFYDPDEAARALRRADPRLSVTESNALAWNEGAGWLRRAIEEQREFAFETTLGGNTIPALLAHAAEYGFAVRMNFVALRDPDLHVERVRARVARGGHDIPEARIRARYDRSRANLVRLLPLLAELVLWDNSEAGDPEEGIPPRPLRVLHLLEGELVEAIPPGQVPEWAKPIYVTAFELSHPRE